MVISHNLLAMNANRMLGITSNTKAKSTEKLSSGYRINRSADDAAGLAISEKMRRQIRGLTQAADNCQDGISFTQVADGALNEVHDMLQRINELSIQAANGTNTSMDRQFLDMEVQNIKDEMTRIFETTEYNGLLIWTSPYVPDVKRNSDRLDFTLFNDTQTGKLGGITIREVRYTWDELGIRNQISDDGLSFKGSGRIDATLPNGEILALTYKKDDPLEKLSREYSWRADADGITINRNLDQKISWADMNLDPSNVQPGFYEFDYAGSTIRFYVPEGDDINDIIRNISGDGLNETTWRTEYAGSTQKTALNLDQYSQISFTQGNQKYLLDTGWEMQADQSGVVLATDTYSPYTKMNWEDFSDITTGKNPIVDWGLSSDWTNAVSLDDTAQYGYSDAVTGFSFQFHMQDETSKEAAIDSINHTTVQRTFQADSHLVTYNKGWSVQTNHNAYQETGDLKIRMSTDLLSFGMQNVLGRDMYQASSFTTTAGISSYDPTLKCSTFSFSVTGKNTNYSVAQTAQYEAKITDDKLKAFIQNGGMQTISLILNNDSQLLASATAAELAEGIKGVNYGLYAQIDCTDISKSYHKALKEREDAYKLEISSANGGWTQQKENDWKADNETILSDHLQAVKESFGSTATPLSKSFSAEQAKITTRYALHDKAAVATDFGFGVNPPLKRLDIQAGAEAYQLITMKWKPLSLTVLSMGATNVKTEASAQQAIATVKQAMQEISLQRSNFGAQQNRMEHTIKNLDNVVENTTAAESAIRDTDMAKEMVNLSNSNIIQQAGQSMLAQANQSKQGILTLL